MKYDGLIMAARRYMHPTDEGEHACACCGRTCTGVPIKKALGDKFTNFQGLLIGGGENICDGCIALLNDKDLRIRPVVYKSPAQKEVIEREDVLSILRDPPDEYVLSAPYSFKKHHWIYAGLSSRKLALVGTDNRTVTIDYVHNDVPEIINAVNRMICAGVPRAEIKAGKYSASTRYNYPQTDCDEQIIRGLRECGAVELLATYHPSVKVKTKNNTREDDGEMLSASENTAIAILTEIASCSQFRREDGIRFWRHYYLRRINRFCSLDLNEFVSRLCASVSTPPIIDLSIVEQLTGDESREVMEEIRKKPDLLVSFAYKNVREAAQ